MNTVFADTSYYGAMLSPNDVSHDAAIRWCRASRCRVVTTEFVLRSGDTILNC